MTELLQSIKSDLLSRRLLPFVALIAVALVAAIGYAVTSGSGSSPSVAPSASPSAPVGGTSALPVVVAPANPNQAVSETPSGTRYQSQGPTRDPFIPLPSPHAATTSAATSSSASPSSGNSTGSSSNGSSSGAGGSSGGGSGGGAPAPAPAPSPKKPAKPQFPYIVSVLFGPASTTPGQPATLAPYENLKVSQLLPSKQDGRISFERVTVNGKGAVFGLLVPPILHGSGVCLPSNSECQAIALQTGQAEELEYIEANGQPVVYELKIVSVVKKGGGASAARVKPGVKTTQARLEAVAAQGIGWANALQVSGAPASASSERR